MVTRAEQIAQLEAQIESLKAECETYRVALGFARSRGESLPALAQDFAAARQRLATRRRALRAWLASPEVVRGPARLLALGNVVRLEIEPGLSLAPVVKAARAHGFRWASREGAFISRAPNAWAQGCRLLDIIGRA